MHIGVSRYLIPKPVHSKVATGVPAREVALNIEMRSSHTEPPCLKQGQRILGEIRRARVGSMMECMRSVYGVYA